MNKIVLLIAAIALVSLEAIAGPKCDMAMTYLNKERPDIEAALKKKRPDFTNISDEDWRNVAMLCSEHHNYLGKSLIKQSRQRMKIHCSRGFLLFLPRAFRNLLKEEYLRVRRR